MDATILAEFKRTACDSLPQRPSKDFAWHELHRRHVTRLAGAWQALLQHTGLRSVVIHSGRAATKYSRDDQYWPQIITPHFAHWLPYEETPALLVVTAGSTPKLFMESHSSYWESAGPGNPNWDPSSFDLIQVKDLSAVQVSAGAAFIGDDLQLAKALGVSTDNCNRPDVMNGADFFRTLKSEFEVASMLVANEIAARGHGAVRDLYLSGDYSELELHQAYLAATSQTDFSVPYGNIVAVGANCGVLHHVHYDRVRRQGDSSLLVDAGAKFNGYASDITRTWARGHGPAVEAFRKLVSGVDEVQKQLVTQCVVGQSYEDLHNRAHFLLADVLIASGIVGCSRDEAVSTGVTRVFFPHGLGHSLGIQVHDVGMKLRKPGSNNPYLRNTSDITQGQVVTIEPGLYFIPSLLNDAKSAPIAKAIDFAVVNKLTSFGGIRIEDNILATNKGPVNLSVGNPRWGSWKI